jgi:hypothetical protein
MMKARKILTIGMISIGLILSAWMAQRKTTAGHALAPSANRPGLPLAAVHGLLDDFFVIYFGPNPNVSPSVAYNSQRQEYLVVWYNDRAGCDDIQARRVTWLGQPLGSDPFIFISAGCDDNRRYPDVAYNSQHDQYLVVWEHEDASGLDGIYGRRLSGAGQVIDSSDIQIRSPGGLYTPAKPAVAYASTSDKYLVVWEETWHPMPITHQIVGQVINDQGALEGGQIVISEATGSDQRQAPDLAYNRRRNEYLVAWQQYDSVAKLYNIYARRVTGNGMPLNPAAIEIARMTVSNRNPAVAALPSVEPDGEYLVVWEMDYAPGDKDILGLRVDPDGNVVPGWLNIDRRADDQFNPAVFGNEGSRQYLVSWVGPGYFDTDIFARAIDIDPVGATLSADEYVGAYYADNPAVAGDGVDFLIAYDDSFFIPPEDIFGQMWGNHVYLPMVVR